MRKILNAYLLIIFGLFPVIIKICLHILGRLDIPLIFHDKQMFRVYQEYGTGIVISSFFIGIILMTIGWMMLKKEKVREQARIDEELLNAGEKVLFRHDGSSSVVTITNQRVRYYGFFTRQLRLSAKYLPDSDREDYFLKEIADVKAVSSSDVKNSKSKFQEKWGIQLKLKNRNVINIPASAQEEITEQIRKLLS